MNVNYVVQAQNPLILGTVSRGVDLSLALISIYILTARPRDGFLSGLVRAHIGCIGSRDDCCVGLRTSSPKQMWLKGRGRNIYSIRELIWRLSREAETGVPTDPRVRQNGGG
jgi:hypothetical protein